MKFQFNRRQSSLTSSGKPCQNTVKVLVLRLRGDCQHMRLKCCSKKCFSSFGQTGKSKIKSALVFVTNPLLHHYLLRFFEEETMPSLDRQHRPPNHMHEKYHDSISMQLLARGLCQLVAASCGLQCTLRKIKLFRFILLHRILCGHGSKVAYLTHYGRFFL